MEPLVGLLPEHPPVAGGFAATYAQPAISGHGSATGSIGVGCASGKFPPLGAAPAYPICLAATVAPLKLAVPFVRMAQFGSGRCRIVEIGTRARR